MALYVGTVVKNINPRSRHYNKCGRVVREDENLWTVAYADGHIGRYKKDVAHRYVRQHGSVKCEQKEQPVQQPLTNLTGKYIIWSPSGTHNPRVVHGTWDVADEEARRLTMQHEQVFYVAKLQSKYSVQVTKTVAVEV